MENAYSPSLTVEYTRQTPSVNYIQPSAYANAIHSIGDEAAAYIDKHSFFCTIAKGKVFLKAGTICPYIFIVNKGVVRGFMKDGKKEITTWITAENEMVTSISSFFSQQPSLENVQALEDCELTGLYYDKLQYLYDRFPEMNTVGRKLLEKYYSDAEERAYLGRLSKASKKYAHFLVTKPSLINRIPLKYVASYMGITLETLSRLRTTLSKKKRI
ncbi:MAG: Crp/Fnr family transcriptional regulator [Bacteroidota bacterium]